MRRVRAREKGFAWIFTAMTMVIIIPMVGLAIDTSVLYIVKAKLQGAVDGAALAGARALSRGSDGATQIAAAQAAAQAYVRLNIPAGYMLTTNLVVPTPTIDLSVAFQRRISVTATVDSPALFMRYVGVNLSTVRASAETLRLDVNIAMVLDRSGSMNTVIGGTAACEPMKAAAKLFVSKFAPGRDNISLISFASTTFVHFPMANNFTTATPNNVPALIDSISCNGSTSSAMALWTAYDQLVALNNPGALNFILFFTDGQPTAVAYKMPIATASPCTAFTPYSPPSSAPPGAKGFIPGLYSTYSNASQFFGSVKYQGTGSGGIQTVILADQEIAANSNNCAYAGSVTNTSDFVGVPTVDIFGNSSDTGYYPITHTGSLINISDNNNAPNMALNAADDAARRIRIGTTDPVWGRGLNNVTIFSIGLGNAAFSFSPVFLERVSNDVRSPIYDSTKPEGLFVSAPTTDDLAPAFSRIASEVLRLAR